MDELDKRYRSREQTIVRNVIEIFREAFEAKKQGCEDKVKLLIQSARAMGDGNYQRAEWLHRKGSIEDYTHCGLVPMTLEEREEYEKEKEIWGE